MALGGDLDYRDLFHSVLPRLRDIAPRHPHAAHQCVPRHHVVDAVTQPIEPSGVNLQNLRVAPIQLHDQLAVASCVNPLLFDPHAFSPVTLCIKLYYIGVRASTYLHSLYRWPMAPSAARGRSAHQSGLQLCMTSSMNTSASSARSSRTTATTSSCTANTTLSSWRP